MFYRVIACAGIVDGVQQNIVHPDSWRVLGTIIATALFWTLADREALEAVRVSSAKQG
jgi:hypothetical protein